MANLVVPTPYFEAKIKRLARKFPSLGYEMVNIEKLLTKIQNLENQLVRIFTKSGWLQGTKEKAKAVVSG